MLIEELAGRPRAHLDPVTSANWKCSGIRLRALTSQGRAGERQMTLNIGEQAPEVTFGDADGVVALSDLYAEKPVVVAFMRHFG